MIYDIENTFLRRAATVLALLLFVLALPLIFTLETICGVIVGSYRELCSRFGYIPFCFRACVLATRVMWAKRGGE